MSAGPSNRTSGVGPTTQTYEDLILQQCTRLNEMQAIDRNVSKNNSVTRKTQQRNSAAPINRSLYISTDESIASSMNLVLPTLDGDVEAELRADEATLQGRRKSLLRRGNGSRSNRSVYMDTIESRATSSMNLGLPTMEAEMEAEMRAHEATLRVKGRTLSKTLAKVKSSLTHRIVAKAKHICCCLRDFVKIKKTKEGTRKERGKGWENQGGEGESEVDKEGGGKQTAHERSDMGHGAHGTCGLDAINRRAEGSEPPRSENRPAVRSEDYALERVQTSSTFDTVSTTLSQMLRQVHGTTEPERPMVVVGRATRPVGVGEGPLLVHQELEVRSLVPSVGEVQVDPHKAYRSGARSYAGIQNWLLKFAPPNSLRGIGSTSAVTMQGQVELHATQDVAGREFEHHRSAYEEAGLSTEMH